MRSPLDVPPGVYAITPDDWSTERILAVAEQLLDAGIAILQLRSKHLDASQRERLGRQLLTACEQHSVPLIINDDASLAARIGAAGVHLGMEDGDIESARRVLGPDAWIGVSCYGDAERAHRLADAGACYVAFGSVYPTPSKHTPHRAPLSLFERWQRHDVPTVAIGGLNTENAGPVCRSGARWLAMIHALWGAAEPASVVRTIQSFYSLPIRRSHSHD